MSKILLDIKLYIDRENFDFEAGSITLAKIIRKKAKISLSCIEIVKYFKYYKSILIKIGFKVFEDINKIKNQYDFIHSSNIIKHIYEDVKSLNVFLKKSQ
tara:strand:- start:40 stop:339 length:300 start_codon:yes stop_codon:yes gene_type:complete